MPDRLPPRETLAPGTQPLRVRKRKNGVGQDKFYIDPEMIPDGMSWEWKRKSTFGQDDVGHQIEMLENGWEAVDSIRAPGYMPPKWRGAIERDGLVLMERPMELTMEARAEDLDRARKQVRNKEEELGLTPPGHMKRTGAKVGKTLEPMLIPE